MILVVAAAGDGDEDGDGNVKLLLARFVVLGIVVTMDTDVVLLP